MVRRRRMLRSMIVPGVTILVSALFIVNIVSIVLGPTQLAYGLGLRLQRMRGRYIAEDVFVRALESDQGLRKGDVARLEEGDLSPFPHNRASVEMRRVGGATKLLCRLVRPHQQIVFLADYTRGVVPQSLGWALGQVDPDASMNRDGVWVRGIEHRLGTEPGDSTVHPLLVAGSWDFSEDLRVHATTLRAAIAAGDMNLGNFRFAPELPLARLAGATDLDDFELGHVRGERLVAAFRARRDLVVRVHGHLWLGRGDEPLLVGTSGRTLVLFVTGNIYVAGSVRMLGPRDRLILVAGRPGWPAFRDANANGRRDPGEAALGGSVERALAPSEGAGQIYVGFAARPEVQATLIARHDVVIGEYGASVQGAVLAGTRLIRSGRHPGRLELTAETRFHGPVLPLRGLPVLPGTETRDRVTSIRLLSAQRPPASVPLR